MDTGPFDCVIANGRVIDPESKLDAVRSIGIKDGKIMADQPGLPDSSTPGPAAQLRVFQFVGYGSHDSRGRPQERRHAGDVQSRHMGIKSSDIVYLKTGERPASNERLAQLRKEDPKGLVPVHFLDETRPEDRKLIDRAILHPDAAIASDAALVPNGVDSSQ
jgi:hypothetical protein